MTNGQIITTLIILVAILAVLVAVLGYANDDARRRLSIARNKQRNLAKRVYRAEAAVKGLELRLGEARGRADASAVERDQARERVTNIQRAMHQQRMNTYTLLGRIKQLEGDNEPNAPTTPLPSQILADDVVAAAEAILRQVGGQP